MMVKGVFAVVHHLQLLAMLLKKKRSLLNSHILHLTFSLVGTVDSGHETSIIPNSTAFQDLLCDFEVRGFVLTNENTMPVDAVRNQLIRFYRLLQSSR